MMNFVEQYNDFCLNYLRCLRKVAASLWITQSQALCIQAIPFDGISQTNLADKLSLDLSTLSRNLDILIKINLIKKKQSTIDKRSFIIFLTSRGVETYHDLSDLIQNSFQDIYKSLTDDEVDHMLETLNKINWEFELSK